MAEIRVERKQRSILPWVLGLLLLALAIWGLVELADRSQESQVRPGRAVETTHEPSPLPPRQFALTAGAAPAVFRAV